MTDLRIIAALAGLIAANFAGISGAGAGLADPADDHGGAVRRRRIDRRHRAHRRATA